MHYLVRGFNASFQASLSSEMNSQGLSNTCWAFAMLQPGLLLSRCFAQDDDGHQRGHRVGDSQKKETPLVDRSVVCNCLNDFGLYIKMH